MTEDAIESRDPVRLVDTRPGEKTIDSQMQGQGPIPAGGTLDVPNAGRAGLPTTDIGAAIINVTAINPTGRGYITIYPCGTMPLASSLNYPTAGVVVGNEVIAKLSPTGSICAYAHATTHLTIDLVGHIPGSGRSHDRQDGKRVNSLRPSCAQ